MAELTQPRPARWTSRQTIVQFRAVAWLRWRILVNGFRRKGGASEIVARIILYPVVVAFALFPTVGSGIAAWYFTRNALLGHVDWLLWGAFFLGQFLSINLGRPGTTFNPIELIRFPVRLRSFVAIRLFFGMLAPANVLVVMISLAIALGIGMALPGLLFPAFVALGVFALANVLFTRMIFAWVDRWLSTRRAREVFTALVFVASMGFQWLNVTLNPAYNHHHEQAFYGQYLRGTVHFLHRIHPILAFLPPELTTTALLSQERGSAFLFFTYVAATALFGVAFLTVFALRTRTEFHGEALSDVANAVAATPRRRISRALRLPARALNPSERRRSVLLGMLGKELLYVRRNTGLFYSLIVPILMVFLFATRISAHGNSFWLLPAAIAYVLFGVMPLSYNIFGLEATGMQFYFLAPIRLRDLFLAKNLLNVLLAAIEVATVIAMLTYMGVRPKPELIIVSLLWAASTLLIGMTLGNHRSVRAPMRIEFSRAAGKQASPLSALMSMGVLIGFAALGWGILLLVAMFHIETLLVPIFACLAAAASVLYILGLRKLESFTLVNREALLSMLCKQ
ncbi:MAG TPA: hypothetical protein VM865_00020 [Acidobacteriaceae bacterium]|jgi:ABC-2 type transport system permease protein|nr:hypothetical protein [Acidobacteriaceae bacterium]